MLKKEDIRQVKLDVVTHVLENNKDYEFVVGIELS